MPKKKLLERDFRNEEIRGLFVLGLLAVLSSLRVQSDTLTVSIGQLSFNIIPIMDITIILWSFYAFFMVFGLSEDVIGKTASNAFREAAKSFLYFNFVVLVSLSLLFGYIAYPTRLPWALGLILVLILYPIYAKLREIRRKSVKINVKKIVKSNLSGILGITILICFTMIMFGVHEVLVIPFFIIGCLAALSWSSIQERKKH